MNKKGFTLVELIISIALITIVITFLFNLLTDVKASDNNIDFNRKNQQKRALILKTIQEDLTTKKLQGIKSRKEENNLIIDFTYQDSLSSLTIHSSEERDYLTYQNTKGEIEKWNLEKQSPKSRFNTKCIKYDDSLHETMGSLEETQLAKSEYFFIKISIPVIVNDKRQNNIDDLELFYIGLKNDLGPLGSSAFPSSIGLGDYENNECKK